MNRTLAAVGAFVFLNFAGQAGAQDFTIGELRAKDATVLSADELKSLMTGATVRYENAKFRTQFKMETNGKLVGSTQRTMGTAGGTTLTGDWKVTDQGQWCGSITSAAGGAGSEWCRTVLKLGSTYYYAAGAAKDPARPAYEMKVSK